MGAVAREHRPGYMGPGGDLSGRGQLSHQWRRQPIRLYRLLLRGDSPAALFQASSGNQALTTIHGGFMGGMLQTTTAKVSSNFNLYQQVSRANAYTAYNSSGYGFLTSGANGFFVGYLANNDSLLAGANIAGYDMATGGMCPRTVVWPLAFLAVACRVFMAIPITAFGLVLTTTPAPNILSRAGQPNGRTPRRVPTTRSTLARSIRTARCAGPTAISPSSGRVPAAWSGRRAQARRRAWLPGRSARSTPALPMAARETVLYAKETGAAATGWVAK